MWIKQKGSRKPRDIATTINPTNGYIQVRFDGCVYVAQQLIYFYMTGKWPPAHIDHRHRKPSDNRWKFLRPATHAQNAWNSNISKNNTSGYKGVHLSRNSKTKPWAAVIVTSGVRYWLGCFKTARAAATAYRNKAKELRGEFA